MAKLTLTDLGNLSNPTTAVTAINANSGAVENISENFLSRDGTSPNHMLANIDLNSFRVINSGAPISSNDLVRLQDVELLNTEAITTALTELDTVIASIEAGNRLKLTATTNFYINANTGNDSNDGLSTGTAWRTMQHAWDYLRANVDVAGQQVYLNLAAGTYAGVKAEGCLLGVDTLKPIQWVGSGSSTCYVDALTANGGTGVAFKAYNGAAFAISNVMIFGDYGLICANGGYIAIFPDVVFNTSTIAHMSSLYSGEIEISADYSIGGVAPVHAEATLNGTIVGQGRTITLIASPVFSFGMLMGSRCGVCQYTNITIVGSTGTGSKKYDAFLNGVVDTGNAGWTVPGDVAGTTSTGGQFS